MFKINIATRGTSKNPIICNLFFATCVQLMMDKFKWTFVIKIVAYVKIPTLALYIYITL